MLLMFGLFHPKWTDINFCEGTPIKI